MTLDIGQTLKEGFSRLTARTGILLFVVFLVIGVVSTVVQQSLNIAVLETLVTSSEAAGPNAESPVPPDVAEMLREQLQVQQAASPLAVDIPALVALLLVFLLALGAETATMIAIRVFASQRADPVSADTTENLLSVTLNGFVGGIVIAALVGIGLLLFVVPGVFLYVSFLFLRQEIALEDRNFIDALAESWKLTKGSRLSLVGLVAILTIVGGITLVPALLDPIARTAVTLVLGPAVGLFGVAVTTRAYTQLSEAAEEVDSTPGSEEMTALGPDDIPEP
jgi:hypothetical protein